MFFFNRSPTDEAEKHFKQGLDYCDRKKGNFNFDLAIKNFMEAIKLNPEIESYHRELGKVYTSAPLLAITRGISNSTALERYKELATDELNQAQKLDSSQVETYLILGEIYLYSGKNQKAQESFRTAVITASTRFSFLSPLSFIDGLLLKSYAKRRLKHLEQGNSRQADPKMAMACLERAMLFRDQVQYNLADKQLLAAFQFAPDWAWLHKAICKSVAGKG
jgi:tetratricopeptide (TPR) repeat protein